MKNTKINNKNSYFWAFFILSIMCIVGIFNILLGINPIILETKVVNNKINAQIKRKSIIFPLKDIVIDVQNIRQAIVTYSISKGNKTYRVELESFDNKKYPVTTFYSSGYNAKYRLQNEINKSIKDKTNFKTEIKQTVLLFVGSFFLLISFIIMFFSIPMYKRSNYNYKEANRKALEKIAERLLKTNNIEEKQPIKEEDKYKDINNSIIK